MLIRCAQSHPVNTSKKATILAIISCRVAVLSCKFIVSFLSLCLFVATVTYAQPDPARKVLILNSYHKEFKWTDAQVSGVKEVLTENIKNLELFVEYMDTKRIYNEEYLEYLVHVYQMKYKKVKLDAIITTDDNALWFVVKYHKEVFGGAPVSFCGINDYKKSVLEGEQQFTGLVEVLDVKPTIDLALRLHPETRKIVVVVDSTPTGLGQIKDVAAVARHYNNLEFEYLEGKDITHAELFEKLRSLSRDSIVLLTVWLRDKNNVFMSSDSGGSLISSNSTVPVYGIIDMYYGNGIVGGKLLNSQTHGRIAAELALRVIKGEKPATIPVIFESTNPYMFDYKQLERWGISLSDLPKDSSIINKPFSFYAEYKRLIWIIVGVFVFLLSVVILLATNIVLRKRSEKELRTSEVKYRELVQDANSIILRMNTKGEITFFNEFAQSFFDFTEEEIIGKNGVGTIVPETESTGRDLAALIGDIGLHPEKYQNTINENMNRRGERLWVAWTNRAIRDKEGKVVEILCVGNDITARKRTEDELAKLATAIKQANETVMLLGTDGVITYVNPALEEQMGFSSSELIGTNLISFDRRPDQKNIFQNAWKIINEGNLWSGHMSTISKDGSICEFDVTISPIRDSSGNITSFVSIARNVTKELAMEERLHRAEKMEALGTLAGGVAHDLNNVLGGIVGYPDLLLHDIPEDSPMRSSLLAIKQSGQRASAIVQDLLTLARRGVQVTEVVNLNTILTRCLESVEYKKLEEFNPDAKIVANLEKDLLNILGSPVHLTKTVINLLTNAVEAMPGEGGITISSENRYLDKPIKGYDSIKEGDYVVLSVKDNGTGIAGEDLDKIFEPFYTKKVMGRSGTGLGMAVVWGTVKDHQGYLDVESIEGQGTTFTLYFPVTREEVASVKEPVSIEEYSGNGEKILIVDDVETQRDIAADLLKKLNYTVEAVASGEEALEYMRNNVADLLVLDMIMYPGIDGLDTYRSITEMYPGQKAIIASGFSETDRVREAQKLGAGAYIRKPYTLEKIGLAVKNELERKI